MSEEEKNETIEEPQDTDAPSEDTDASAADPVAEEEPRPRRLRARKPPPRHPRKSEPEAEAPESEPAGDPDTPGSGAEDGSGGDSDLPWKERRRLERSRRPHEPGPQRSAEERAGERAEGRRRAGVARRRYREAQRGKQGEPGTGTPAAERRANPAKTRQGVVVSDRADKTITVRIDIARRHPTYEKVVRRSRTLHAHDERNEAGEGDIVRVIETRPLSRTKRWRLVEVIEKAK